MIRIAVRRDPRGKIRELRCSGHAAFDIEGGVDIVCAAVSALMSAVDIGLEKVVGIEGATVAGGDGLVDIALPADIDSSKDESAQIVLETAVVTLKEIANSYQGFIEFE